jgi:hypothetical protein
LINGSSVFRSSIPQTFPSGDTNCNPAYVISPIGVSDSFLE